MKRTMLSVLLLAAISGFAVPPPPPPVEGLKPIDPLRYGSQQEFQKAWKTGNAATVGTMLQIGGQTVVKLPCAFERKEIRDRAWWDLPVHADLRNSSALAVDLYLEKAEGISSFTIYLISKDGKRAAHWNWDEAPLSGGKWNRLYLPLADFGSPIDLADVATIRISPWKRRERQTVVYLANLCHDDRPQKIVVLHKNSTPFLANQSVPMTVYLGKLGIRNKSIVTEALTPDDLKGAELVIVPFYPGMNANTAQVLADFIASGGKVIACRELHPILGKAIGAEQTAFPAGFKDRDELRNTLKYMSFQQPPTWVPRQVVNVFGRPGCFKKTADDAEVLAEWRFSDGSYAHLPAIIVSPRGAVLSHGFNTNRDREGQRRLFLHLIATCAPGLRQELAEKRLEELDAALGEPSWEASLALLKRQNNFNPDSEKLAAEAGRLREEALTALKSGDCLLSIQTALDARDKIREAFFRAQKPVRNVRRFYAFQHADGLAGDNWDESVRVVKAGGFTDIVVNLQGCGGAAYPSKYVPYYLSWHSPREQDNLSLCLEACRKYGVRLHVWNNNLKLLYCSNDWRQKLEQAGRLQVAPNGKFTDWLCPTHPENIKLQGDLMCEAAERGVAGVSFDYIRYEFSSGCYCARCRELFEKRIGRKVASWPRDVVGAKAPLNAEFQRFREDNITAIVRETSRRVREVAPKIEISGSFAPYPSCLDNYSQDWMKWIKEGYLDFYFPMIYTADTEAVRETTLHNLKISSVPSYSYVGSYKLDPVAVVKQINVICAAGGKGFALFSMAADGESYLAALGKGITSDLAEPGAAPGETRKKE